LLRYLSILGSTGSIGQQTLEVVAEHPEHFTVTALAAGTNWKLLAQQILHFRPKIAYTTTKELAENIRSIVPDSVQIVYGEQGLLEVATHPDVDFVVSAVVGSAGLPPTLAAIQAGKTIGLANKETLVTAGHIIMEQARQYNVEIIPIDSEHSAIFQCLQGEELATVRRMILTASGGSFRDLSREELGQVTVKQALDHPNWKMGAKITIDSATMMNKGLEVIEAHWLFGLSFSRIETILHRESIIHSMVEFTDKAMMAQLGTPDMRVPIQYALTYPARLPLSTASLNLWEIGTLHFAPLSMERYPALKLAYQCGQAGGSLPAVLNAANEVIVQRFLQGELAFADIESAIETVLGKHHSIANPTLEAIQEVDLWTRREALYV
jgi:1-deoxy-D-xylulose-5-phosphate reductoisomerase